MTASLTAVLAAPPSLETVSRQCRRAIAKNVFFRVATAGLAAQDACHRRRDRGRAGAVADCNAIASNFGFQRALARAQATTGPYCVRRKDQQVSAVLSNYPNG